LLLQDQLDSCDFTKINSEHEEGNGAEKYLWLFKAAFLTENLSVERVTTLEEILKIYLVQLHIALVYSLNFTPEK